MLLDALPHASFLDVGNLVNRAHPLAKGLVAWWLVLPASSGGTKLQDLLGRNHGTLTNVAASPTATSGWQRTTRRPGGSGALALDGTNDYVDVPVTGLGVPLTLYNQPFTVSAWFKARTPSQSIGRVLAMPYDAAAGIEGYTFVMQSNNVTFYVNNGAVPVSVGVGFTDTARWHLLAGTATATLCIFYIDGVTVGTVARVTSNPYSNGNFQIGRFNTSFGQYFQGEVDDVRFWNYVMSPSQVQSLYHHSRQGYPDLLNRLPLFPQAPVAPGSLPLPGSLYASPLLRM